MAAKKKPVDIIGPVPELAPPVLALDLVVMSEGKALVLGDGVHTSQVTRVNYDLTDYGDYVTVFPKGSDAWKIVIPYSQIRYLRYKW